MMRRALLLLILWCGLAQAGEPVRYQLVSNLNPSENMLIVGEKNPWRDRTLRVGIISENTSPYNIIVDDDLYGLNGSTPAA